MESKNLHTLLSIIENKGSIHSLIDKGLSFKAIATLTNFAINNRYLILEGDILKVTEVGNEKLIELRSKLKTLDHSQWIKKDSKFIIKKHAKDFIYLPDQNDLNFKALEK